MDGSDVTSGQSGAVALETAAADAPVAAALAPAAADAVRMQSLRQQAPRRSSVSSRHSRVEVIHAPETTVDDGEFPLPPSVPGEYIDPGTAMEEGDLFPLPPLDNSPLTSSEGSPITPLDSPRPSQKPEPEPPARPRTAATLAEAEKEDSDSSDELEEPLARPRTRPRTAATTAEAEKEDSDASDDDEEPLASPRTAKILAAAEEEERLTPRADEVEEELTWEVLKKIAQETSIRELPLVLLVTFCLVPSVSTAIFQSFACDSYQVSVIDGTNVKYLHTDASVECDTDFHEYIKGIAYVFLAVWPAGVPLFFMYLLLRARNDIQNQRPSRASRAVDFLHSEYRSRFFFWEVFELVRRIVLTGGLLLIPVEVGFIRILTAVAICVASLLALCFLQPFRSTTNNIVALATSFSQTLAFISCLVIKLHVETSEEHGPDAALAMFGFDDVVPLCIVLIVFYFGVLVLVATILVVEATAESTVPMLRDWDTGVAPRLHIEPFRKWHVFLSHVWGGADFNGGQDQCGALKRRLQMLVPQITCFLDVDDLQNIGDLEAYVDQSEVVIIFLTDGYFRSRNCQREIRYCIETSCPLVWVWETDRSKGGLSLEELRNQCPDDLLAQIDALPAKYALTRDNVVPWQRVSFFQLEALKVLTSKVITVFRWPKATPSAIVSPLLYMPKELILQSHQFDQPIVVYVSKRANPGAVRVAEELDKWQQRKKMGDSMIFITECPWKKSYRRDRQSRFSRAMGAVRMSGAGRRSNADGAMNADDAQVEEIVLKPGAVAPDLMLLYLNEKTWPGLAEEVRFARKMKTPQVLVHEQDEREHGCEFGAFFKSTPQDLLDDGIYRPLAVAWHPPPLREVSIVLAARALGAVAKDGGRWREGLEQLASCCRGPSGKADSATAEEIAQSMHQDWRKQLEAAADAEKRKAKEESSQAAATAGAAHRVLTKLKGSHKKLVAEKAPEPSTPPPQPPQQPPARRPSSSRDPITEQPASIAPVPTITRQTVTVTETIHEHLGGSTASLFPTDRASQRIMRAHERGGAAVGGGHLSHRGQLSHRAQLSHRRPGLSMETLPEEGGSTVRGFGGSTSRDLGGMTSRGMTDRAARYGAMGGDNRKSCLDADDGTEQTKEAPERCGRTGSGTNRGGTSNRGTATSRVRDCRDGGATRRGGDAEAKRAAAKLAAKIEDKVRDQRINASIEDAQLALERTNAAVAAARTLGAGGRGVEYPQMRSRLRSRVQAYERAKALEEQEYLQLFGPRGSRPGPSGLPQPSMLPPPSTYSTNARPSRLPKPSILPPPTIQHL